MYRANAAVRRAAGTTWGTIACSMGRNGAVSDADVPSVPKKPAISSSGYSETKPKTAPVRAISTASTASVRRRPQPSACTPIR